MKKIVIFLSTVFILAITLSALATWPALAAGRGSPRVAAAQGLLTVQGRDVLVEVLVGVLPGEDGPEKARGALRRMYPHAIEVDSEAYTLNGVEWDQFFDGDEGNDYVTVHYNSNNTPIEGTIEGVDRLKAALNTWTVVPISKFAFDYAGKTSRCPSLVKECRGPQRFDGNNDVGWLSIDEPYVLGVCWYGTTIDEFDIVLDNDLEWNWYFGGTLISDVIDAETIWLHEFGHGLGLGHSSITKAVMYDHYDVLKRDLHWDDIDGITALYPASLCESDLDCNDGDICTDDTCDLATGLCSNIVAVVCDDGIACTADSCDPLTGECIYEPNDSVCNDGDICTDDICDPVTGDEVTGCSNDPIPDCSTCTGAGGSCTVNDNCCSQKCVGRPNAKRCK